MFLKKYVKHAWAVLWQSQIKHGLANHLPIWLASLIQPNLAEGMFGFARLHIFGIKFATLLDMPSKGLFQVW